MTSAFNLQGRWINQNDSVLVITEVEDSVLKGVFESKKGRAARNIAYPVLGIHNNEVVSFMVNFKDGDQNLHSISSFSGRLVKDRDGLEQIHTVWVLARQFEDVEMRKATQPWNAFITNSDIFTKFLG